MISHAESYLSNDQKDVHESSSPLSEGYASDIRICHSPLEPSEHELLFGRVMAGGGGAHSTPFVHDHFDGMVFDFDDEVTTVGSQGCHQEETTNAQLEI